MNKTLYKTITSLFLGGAILFSAPVVYADKNDHGWKKHDRHSSHQHNQRHHNKYNKHKNKHSKRHNKRHNKHKQNRWVRNNHHNHASCNVRSHNHNHNTRHHNTRHYNNYNNTRHHNTRHNNHNHIRHNIRQNNTRFNDVFNSLVIDFASSSNSYPVNNHYANNKGNIWKRQKNQKRRIHHGVKSGQLTHKETKKLRRGLRKIRDKIAYFKSDGHFVRQERRKVHTMLDRSSDRIYQKKHNRVTRSNQHSNQYSDYRTANNNNNSKYNYHH